MPKVDLASLPERNTSSYPAPLDAFVAGRHVRRGVGDAGGLTQFGVNLVRMEPGAMSALRHWHEKQDEFVMVTAGQLVLIEDEGETVLNAGDCATFPAGSGNGHHLVNRTEAEATFLVVGTRTDEENVSYPDTDLRYEMRGGVTRFLHRDGTPFGVETPETDAFAGLSAALTRALLEGDADLYRGVFHLPARVTPRSGDGYTLTTDDEVREDFRLYREAILAQGITGITREVERETRPDGDTCIVEARVTFLKDDAAMVEPFITTFRLERRAGTWRIARIISSLGHISWTRGTAGITQELKFELD